MYYYLKILMKIKNLGGGFFWIKFCAKNKLNPLMATFKEGQEELEKEWIKIYTENNRKQKNDNKI